MQAMKGIVMRRVREAGLLISWGSRTGGFMRGVPNSRRFRKRPTTDQAGFTLLELLVVIAILGLLVGLVAPAALRQLGVARGSVARQSIERIGSVLDIYKLDVGSYPSSDQGLQALVQQPSGITNWNGPYLKGDKVPTDPWNRPYVYQSPSTRPGHDYDLCSRSETGNAGGEQMICNN